MVAINFKLSDIGKIEVPLKEDETLVQVLDKAVLLAEVAPANLKLNGLMVIRRGRVLRENDLLTDLDEIEIFPAISGG